MTAVYLDYAAATPLDKRVLAEMMPYLTTEFYNPSATYLAARTAQQALGQARERVARVLGAKPSEIIFTAGGTEANNLAIHGIMRQYPDANIVISAVEHSSVVKPAARYDCRTAPVNSDGRLNLAMFANSVDEQTVLVSCMSANNEIGTVQPIRELARLCEDIRAQRRLAGNKLPLYLHVDACQAPNYLDIQISRLGADLISFNGSKIYGPKQAGALYVKGGLVLQPLIDGGGQERGLRSGTENIAGAVGFAAALEKAAKSRHSESERLQKLQNHWFERLNEEIPQAVINGSLKFRLPNNIHLTIPGADNERLLFALDDLGIMAAAGSACSASRQTPSTVLQAIGLDDETAQSSLRFTMGRQTTIEEVDQAIDSLKQIIAKN